MENLTAQMNGFRQLASTVGAISPDTKDELRLQALQKIAESLEQITTSPLYPSFLEHAVPIFLRILNDTEPVFLQEHHGQQLRKLLLDVLHRLPVNEPLRSYVRSILTLMFKLLEIDNEENVLICLKIIIELHKQFRPAHGPEVSLFLI
jgi:transformation/transcription domain-associated protein